MTQHAFLPGDDFVRETQGRPSFRRALAAVAGVLLLSGCGSAASEGQPTTAVATPDHGPTSQHTDQVDVAPDPAAEATPVGGLPWDDATTQACTPAVPSRFTQAAQVPEPEAVTSFWTSGPQWVLCDVWAAAHEPGIIASATGPQRGFNERALAVSAVPGDGGVRFVAGGRLPWPVQEISYTFPDGHTEQARFVTSKDTDDVWWVVAYTATAGPLADPATDPERLDPVTISIIGAAAEAFRLPWEDLQAP